MTKAYLDNIAGTPILPEVLKDMLPFLKDAYGNPQSVHSWGDQAREAMDDARGRVAKLISADPEEIIFTGSGTEANNLAIKGLARAHEAKGKHIVISAIEHFSVMHSAKTMEKAGFEVTMVPVDAHGVINLQELAKSIRKDTILVSIMHANSEIGTVQPMQQIAEIVRKSGAVFHTDAVATAGTIPIDVTKLDVDALSMASSQFYGPRGAGALWIRQGVRVIPLLDGGVQEGGRRAGTEDVPAIVGMGKAAELATRGMKSRRTHVQALRDQLIRGLLPIIEASMLTGHPAQRLPGHASFVIKFIEGESMLMLLSHQGIAASSGSACTSKALKASHVLSAIGIPHEEAHGSLVFSFGLQNTAADVEHVLETLPPIVDKLRQMSPLYAKFMKEQKGDKGHAGL